MPTGQEEARGTQSLGKSFHMEFTSNCQVSTAGKSLKYSWKSKRLWNTVSEGEDGMEWSQIARLWSYHAGILAHSKKVDWIVSMVETLQKTFK